MGNGITSVGKKAMRKLIGTDVLSAGGMRLGVVDAILRRRGNSGLTCVVLRCVIPGYRHQTFALPAQTLTFDPVQDCLVWKR